MPLSGPVLQENARLLGEKFGKNFVARKHVARKCESTMTKWMCSRYF